MSAQTRADVTGYTYTVEEVPDAPDPKPDPTSTTERLVGLLRDRHARGLAKYGTTLDREDLTPQQWAQHAIEEALDLAGYLMRLKDGFAPEPGSTAAHHVEIPRDRVKELEEMVETLRKKLNETLTDNDDIHRDLALAIEIGDAMREAMRHGAWGHDGEGHLASVSAGSWDRFKTSLAKAPSVPVGASDAPGEGGDSDRRRLEALERWLRGNTYRMVYFSSRGVIVAGSDSIGDDDMEAPTLPALADKLAEKEAKP
jgi:hypothetical protein